MNRTNAPTRPAARSVALIVLGSVFVAVLATLGVLYTTGLLTPPARSRQDMVHQIGGQVMPFDLNRTTHIFDMADTGGVQRVVVKDPNDTEQIALIQQHLQHEAMQFRGGNFADPATLHGMDMPGLQDLTAGASKILVEYTALPNGAQITFTTQDAHLVTALHQYPYPTTTTGSSATLMTSCTTSSVSGGICSSAYVLITAPKPQQAAAQTCVVMYLQADQRCAIVFSILTKHAEATRLRHNIGDTFSDVGWQNDITKVQHHNGIRCETPLYEPQRHYEAL